MAATRRAFLTMLAGSASPNGPPARAQAGSNVVDLQLVLAVDASGSVNRERFELQRIGYARAFRDPKVVSAILGGAGRGIAVLMMQWTGPELQDVVIPWSLLDSDTAINTFSDQVLATQRKLYGGGTSISGAIDQAVTLFPTSPYQSDRRVIDISGDGSNNRGRAVTSARDDAVASGIRINGLPILTLEPDLDEYYKASVIGGSGAFSIATATYETFADAIIQKLILEISGMPCLDAVAPA
jgi:hypothetical protein